MNDELTPEEAFVWLTEIVPHSRSAALEQVVMQSAGYIYEYAKYLGHRWIEAEPVVLKSKWAYCYIKYVALKGHPKIKVLPNNEYKAWMLFRMFILEEKMIPEKIRHGR